MTSFSYSDFIEEGKIRQPLVVTAAATPIENPFFLSSVAPTGGADGSIWVNIDSEEGKIYVKYQNNWIGLK